MSEILRAVLDKSCVFSEPAFYTVEHTFAAAAPAATQTQFLETKLDREFLLTSFTLTTATGTDGGTGLVQQPATNYVITMLRSSRVIFNAPLNSGLYAGNHKSTFTLPEYILISSNDTISVDATPNGPFAVRTVLSLTLNGIEYGK